MPFQQNHADGSYYAQKMKKAPPPQMRNQNQQNMQQTPGDNMSGAYYGGMQASACGCGGAYQPRPQSGCMLAAPAPYVPACMPAALQAGCCSGYGGAPVGPGPGAGAYHRIKYAYGY